MSTQKDKDDDKPTAKAAPVLPVVEEPVKPQRVNENAPNVQKTTAKDKAKARENMSEDDKKIEKLTANNETKDDPEYNLDDAQVVHALRVEGRLWRCKAEGCPCFLCVCEKDADPEQAKKLMKGKYPDVDIKSISAEKLRP